MIATNMCSNFVVSGVDPLNKASIFPTGMGTWAYFRSGIKKIDKNKN